MFRCLPTLFDSTLLHPVAPRRYYRGAAVGVESLKGTQQLYHTTLGLGLAHHSAHTPRRRQQRKAKSYSKQRSPEPFEVNCSAASWFTAAVVKTSAGFWCGTRRLKRLLSTLELSSALCISACLHIYTVKLSSNNPSSPR